MGYYKKNTVKTGVKISLMSAVFFSFIITALAQTHSESTTKDYIGIRVDFTGDPRVPIDKEQKFLGLSLQGLRSYYFFPNLQSLKYSVEMDSSGSFINFRETLFGQDHRLPTYLTVRDYMRIRSQNGINNQWQKYVVTHMGQEFKSREGRGGALRLDIPVEIKSRAFQRIFGGSTVGLNVTGDISINGGFRHEKRDEVRTAITRGSNYNFKMQQTQRFQVQGHVGEKVTVDVDQDSERPFEFDNNIKLNYKGYEDEIVQSIEAGNIALSLPATRFVTFSGNSSGLFGIKADMIVGGWKLTAIASQEKGESKALTLEGGASEGFIKIQDSKFRRGIYYYLDAYYRDRYWGDFDIEKRVHYIDQNRIVTDIEVYLSEANYQIRYPNDSFSGIAGFAHTDSVLAMPGSKTVVPIDTSIDGQKERGFFRRLNTDEYYVDRALGYIRMNTSLSDGQVLAVAFRDSSGREVGSIDFTPGGNRPLILRLLKAKKAQPSQVNIWDLEWMNVYYLGSHNIDANGFDARIMLRVPSGDDLETMGRKRFTEIFGLDRLNQSGGAVPDGKIDIDNNIINLERGELFFPSLRPFAPDTSLGSRYILPKDTEKITELPKNSQVPAVYDTTDLNYIGQESKFYIQVKSQSRQSSYSLGFNVIENSERVMLNGAELKRGKDYTIDYFSGQLNVLNDQALLPSNRLEITYESNQLFQLEKKTIMGMRTQYDFWNNSFVGGTFLYLNERTLDQKIRVGKGPMRNMVWDLNTRLNFESNFMTRALNILPFVESRTTSSINFEGEIAQVLPNPNTQNGQVAADPDGVAYIDDFEASKKITPLGIVRNSWTLASMTAEELSIFSRDNENFKKRGSLNWYNPYEQVPITQIWPNREVNAQVAQRVHVLDLKFTPASPDGLGNWDVNQSWTGIMRYLGAGYSDQTQSKYLEVWVAGDEGSLHIDFGQISEDVIPNGALNSEDREEEGIRNGILDPGEDIGLDGMAGKDGSANSDYWDINADGVKQDWEPVSTDDWNYTTGGADYSRTNGTEGNENDGGVRRPDTEDINGNGILDTENQYLTFSINLDKASPDTAFITGVGGAWTENAPLNSLEGHWIQYRIPLTEPTDRVGNPTLQTLDFARLRIDGCSRPVFIRIAEINFVGSDWREQGVANPIDPENYQPDDEMLSVAVINTHENDNYAPPPSVSGVIDRITRVQAREQSLVLRLDNLLPGYNATAQKSFFGEDQDYIHYDELRMFVYGLDQFGRHINNLDNKTKVRVFLRFGSDTKNYYEVRQFVWEGWDKRNEFIVELQELASLKFETRNEDLGRYVLSYNEAKNERSKYFKDSGKIYRVKGKPSLTNIRTLIIGVENMGDGPGEPSKIGDVIPVSGEPFSGEIWLNELRLAGVKKDKGMAMRARLDLKLSDLISFNGEVNKEDADFHNVATRFGTGDNKLSYNFNTTLQVDQFLPKQLGLRIPINFNYRSSNALPKYVPGTDRESSTLTEVEKDSIRNVNENVGYSIQISKPTKSKNFFVQNLVDPISANFSKTESQSSSSSTRYANNGSASASFSYTLRFGQNNFIKPLTWLGGLPILSLMSGTKLYYTPSNLSFKISGTKSNTDSETRTGVESHTTNFNVNRDAQISMNIFESLSLDYSRSYTNDLRNDSTNLWQQFKFIDLTQLDQSLSARYNPKIFTWFTTNLSYSGGFKFSNNLQQALTGRSTANNMNLSASTSLNLQQLFALIYKPKGGAVRQQQRKQPEDKKRKSPEGKGDDFSEGMAMSGVDLALLSDQEPQDDRTTPVKPESEDDKTEKKQDDKKSDKKEDKKENKKEDKKDSKKENKKQEENKDENQGDQKQSKEKKPDAGKDNKKTDESGFSILGILNSAIGVFDPIQGSANFRKNNSLSGISGPPKGLFTIGLGDDSTAAGVNFVEGLNKSNRENHTNNISLNAQSGIKLSRNISMTFKYQRSESETRSSINQGQYSESRFTLGQGDGFPCPDWTLRWGGFETYPFLKKYVQRLSLDHSFSGQMSQSWKDQASNLTKKNLDASFRPLIGMTITWKNGMSTNFSYNKSQKRDIPYTNGVSSGATTSSQADISVTGNYSKRSDFRIPIPVWPFKNMKLKNNVDISLTFTYNTSENKSNKLGGRDVDTGSTKKWSFRPKMNYSFSNTVTGGAFFEIAQTDSKLNGTIQTQEFGINVNISIRGN